ncbi:hypothetical protein LTR84_004175 [Exophiala bonariae]|uniref:Major facilitator superfamily (MFS) profile domain-containing protein n=1 Tax=Exophiala bonariae TaxID=1690606 RepID=A0AAV9N6D1_9EURO|nr:hypothetical protein LTR84_004175 [Exophiala bonariae]
MGNESEEDGGDVVIALAPNVQGTASTTMLDDEPPYGWVVCMSLHFINAFTWGVIASFGVYLSYYISHETFSGTTALEFTFVGGANFVGAMLCTPGVNLCIRYFGTHVPMYIGCVLFAGGFVAASFAVEFWQLVLSQGVLVGLGTGFVWLPATPLLPQWFNRNRSLAQGLAAAGSGIGGITWSFTIVPMIENMSLAWSLRIIGLVSFVVLLVATFLIRDRNEKIRPKIKAVDFGLLERVNVWLLIGYTFFSILGYIVFIYTLSAFGLSLGLTQSQAGIITGMLNVGTAIGRPFVGVISDHYGRITTAGILTASNCVMAFAIWIPTDSYGVLIFLGLVSGATSGIYWGTIAPLTAEVVDLTELPSGLGIMWLAVSMPSLFSEAIALEIRQPGTSRPYLWPQIYTGLSYLAASLLLLVLRKRKWAWRRERHR